MLSKRKFGTFLDVNFTVLEEDVVADLKLLTSGSVRASRHCQLLKFFYLVLIIHNHNIIDNIF